MSQQVAHHPIAGADKPRRTYTNIVLTAIACLLVALVIGSRGPLLTRDAVAQVGGSLEPVRMDDQGLISAAEQRKMMIAELKTIASRMERIESHMAKGLTVKVSEMPASKEAKAK